MKTISKNRSYDFYLDEIQKAGGEFEKLEAFSTLGGSFGRPDYRYQWRATTKHIPGNDDVSEGLGGSPLGAIKALAKAFRNDMELIVDNDE